MTAGVCTQHRRTVARTITNILMAMPVTLPGCSVVCAVIFLRRATMTDKQPSWLQYANTIFVAMRRNSGPLWLTSSLVGTFFFRGSPHESQDFVHRKREHWVEPLKTSWWWSLWLCWVAMGCVLLGFLEAPLRLYGSSLSLATHRYNAQQWVASH